MKQKLFVPIILLFLVVAFACDDDNPGGSAISSPCTIHQSYFSLTEGYTPKCSDLPASKRNSDTIDYPEIIVEGENLLNEGDIQNFKISSSDTISEVYLGVSDQRYENFFHYVVPNETPGTVVYIDVYISPDTISSPEVFLLLFKLKNHKGEISLADTVRIILVPALDAEMNVELKWNQNVDLDLIFVEDSGIDTVYNYYTDETTYVELIDTLSFDNVLSRNQGIFLGDRNPGCYSDFNPPYFENVEYNTRQSLLRCITNYEVLVGLYAACSITENIDYQVTVTLNTIDISGENQVLDTIDIPGYDNPYFGSIPYYQIKEPVSVMKFVTPCPESSKKVMIISRFSNDSKKVSRDKMKSPGMKERYF